MLKRSLEYVPGVASSLLVMQSGVLISSCVSLPAVSAIAGVGLLAPALPRACDRGLRLGSDVLFPAGIVCVGAKLSVLKAATLTLYTVPASLLTMVPVLVCLPLLAVRIGESKHLGKMLGFGFGISGMTSIGAITTVLKPNIRDKSLSLLSIAVFGSLAIVLTPWIAQHFDLTDEEKGVFYGTAIPGASQVAAVGLSETEAVVNIAVLTKLVRSLFLPIMIPIATSATRVGPLTLPTFLWGFMGMVLTRSVGDHYLHDSELWGKAIDFVSNDLAQALLYIGMASLALETSLVIALQSGWKPVFLAGTGFAFMVGSGLLVSKLIGSSLKEVEERLEEAIQSES